MNSPAALSQIQSPAAGLNPPVQPYAGQGMFTPLVVEYLHILQRRKWWIAGVMGGAILLSLVATLLMRPVYTAATQIEVSRDLKNVTNVEGVDSEQVGRDLEFYQTQYSLLEARSLAERVVRRMRLETVESFWNAHGIDPSQFDEGTGPVLRRTGQGDSARQRAAIETLLENVAIEPIRGSSLVDIKYSSYDPDMSAKIANTWATEFIAQSIARKFDSTAEARAYLEQRLAELRDKVEQSERALVDYAAQRNIVTINTGGGSGDASAQVRERTLTADSLEGLNSQLVQATADRVTAEAEARRGGSMATNATLAALRQQRAEAAGEYAELMVRFEPGYPQAQGVHQQIEELDREIAREEGRIGRERQQAYQAALAREQDLRSRVLGLASEVQGQRRDSIQYNIYQREADTNRQLYDSLLQRYKEIGVAGVSANNIAVIDRADAPKKPSSPKLLLNLVLATVAGFIVSLGLVFILEQAQEGLVDPTKVGDLLGVPLLGSIPKLSDEADITSEIRDPKSDISEAYLAIRSSLAFTTDHGVPKSIMVVSSQPAEGKSTSALALAMVLNRVGKKVALIDVDLRNPSIHSFLGIDRSRGASNYLAGENEWASLMHEIAPGLHFMPAGPSVPSAAELLSGERLANLTRELLLHYDHVIVDSTPIIGLADAPLISRTVEAVIFVVEAGMVPVRGLRAALDRLRQAGAPLSGAILTKFVKSHADYGYGYSYRYSYGRSNAESDADD